jgi:uncharacterized membrane protein YbhN (UPF0104 family)
MKAHFSETHQQLARNLILSASCSVLILSLLFSLAVKGGEDAGVSTFLEALSRVSSLGIGVYAGFEFLQAGFRAVRYRWLLRAGASREIPSLRHLYLVTLIRNMLVDLFPGRAGELGYVALLKRGYQVDTEQGLSSLAVSILLDVIALSAVVFCFMAPILIQLTGWMGYVLGAGIVVVVLILCWLGWFRLFPYMMSSSTTVRLCAKVHLFRRAFDFFQKLSGSASEIRKSGLWTPLLLWSALVRVGKYTGLYLLFQTVTHSMWPDLAAMSPWAILLTLILAEGAAALPLPAFMSFGPYEAGGTAALVMMGFEASQAAVTLLVLHVVSQAVGYLIGGTALLIYIYVAPHRKDHVPVRYSGPRSERRPAWRAWLFPVCMLLLSVLVAGWTYRAATKLGAWTAPDAGAPLDIPSEARARLLEAVDRDEGSLVWSSNRHGNHDILRLSLPGLRVERLTDHPHTETYPRFSPDGRSLVFCRSRQPWVSQRNPREWDLVLLDLATGDERLLTEFGYQPAWTPDGEAVVFVRNGSQLVRHRLSDGHEEVLYESGKDGLPGGVEFQTPSPGPGKAPMAVTLRGAMRANVLLEPGRPPERVVSSSGCQMNWSPDGSFLYWTDHGGPSGLQFHRSRAVALEPKRWLDIPSEYSHQYFPRLSRDGRILVMGASTGGHEHDTADYEIHLWRVDEEESDVVRVTFHSGNDGWPDLFLNPSDP